MNLASSTPMHPSTSTLHHDAVVATRSKCAVKTVQKQLHKIPGAGRRGEASYIQKSLTESRHGSPHEPGPSGSLRWKPFQRTTIFHLYTVGI